MTTVLNHRPAPPSAALARVRLELRLFARERQQVVFSFAYPLVMMVIFGSLLGGAESPGGVPFAQYFLAGIAADRLLRGQGRAGQVLVTTVAHLTLLLPVARHGYDVPMPVDLGHWLTFVWVVALGALAGTALGIAVSALGGSAPSLSTSVMGVGVVLRFLPGCSSPSPGCLAGCSRQRRPSR
jgi:ABC-2 type transport system permease protein